MNGLLAAQQHRPPIEPIVTEDWYKCGVALFPLLSGQKTLDGLFHAFRIALMKIPSTLLLLAVLTFSISAPAAPPSDESINQLLQLTKGKPLSAEEQAVLDRQQAKMTAIIKDELNWDKMKDLYIQVYRETFSQEEIDGLIAFYQTPVGQSFVSKQPELTKRTMAIMQQRMAPMMQKIQKMSEETALELKKAKAETSPVPEKN